jgi:hypothetical protein
VQVKDDHVKALFFRSLDRLFSVGHAGHGEANALKVVVNARRKKPESSTTSTFAAFSCIFR